MSRVLVVTPHPDDEAIGCGGALCAHSEAGDTIRLVYLTSGEQGGHGLPPGETARRRETEAGEAARLLGAELTEFWRQPDGALRATRRLVARLRDLVADWRPGLIYATHDGEMHPDHRAAARLVRRALRELPAAVPTPAVRLFEVWTPLQHMDEIVDTSAHIERKLAAIRAYEHQCSVLRFDEAARGLSRYRGEMHSWPGGDYAEVFVSLRP
ncbi:MAG: PIG-L family deacetylase [Armatimonadetes bacterium]|nr:PIG-L family deacetylase [Armatimonadota bacterium]